MKNIFFQKRLFHKYSLPTLIYFVIKAHGVHLSFFSGPTLWLWSPTVSRSARAPMSSLRARHLWREAACPGLGPRSAGQQGLLQPDVRHVRLPRPRHRPPCFQLRETHVRGPQVGGDQAQGAQPRHHRHRQGHPVPRGAGRYRVLGVLVLTRAQ